MSKFAEEALDQMLLAAGIRRPRATRETTGKRLQVARWSRDGRELVGELSCEGGAFVFRYVPGYEGSPIPEFPRKGRTYRSDVLWTFFAVRVPPASRKDVQDVMSRINADDPLEVLAALGGVSVTNPYELRLAVEGADAS